MRWLFIWLFITAVIIFDSWLYLNAADYEGNPIIIWARQMIGVETVVAIKIIGAVALGTGVLLTPAKRPWVGWLLGAVFLFYLSLLIWLSFSWGALLYTGGMK